MKTQVIQLDPHDDVISVRDRMSWARSARILLVYPRRSRMLSRSLDLHLLKRHASTLGGQLAIVTKLERVRSIARDLEIPVFKTAAIAQRLSWEGPVATQLPVRRSPRPDLRLLRSEAFPAEAHWRNLLGIRLGFFSLAVLAVLGLLLLFYPSATLELKPESRLQDLTISASASSKIVTVNLTGSLPARLVFTVVERNQTVPVTGSLVIPAANAAGLLQFNNLTTGVVGIPSGTIVRTTGPAPVRFATTMDAVVPAGVGKTLEVAVQALTGGSAGNLPADTLVAIEGDLGTNLSVTNPDPMIGGSDRTAPVQTAGDRARLRAALISEILDQCKTSLPKSISPGDTYFPDTLAVGQVLTETYFPAEGQTGPTLSLTLNLQCQAQYALAEDVNSLASQALNANLPAGFDPVNASLLTLNSSPPLTDASGVTRWQIRAERFIEVRVDPLKTIQLVQGRTLKAAGRRLVASLRLTGTPKITMLPDWWPWLPVVPFRITISTGG